MIIGARYPPVDWSTLPISRGTRQRPMFCTQKIRQYALPRIFSSIILGTEGHRAAGTREKLTPSTAIRVTASHL